MHAIRIVFKGSRWLSGVVRRHCRGREVKRWSTSKTGKGVLFVLIYCRDTLATL